MIVLFCLLISYIIYGFSQVIQDFGASPIDRVGWTRSPTLVKSTLAVLSWPFRPLIEARFSQNKSRGMAFGILNFILKMVILSAIIWILLITPSQISDRIFIQIPIFVLLVPILFLVALPIVNIIIIPIVLVLSIPLDLIFPLKDKVDTKSIVWCRNCQNYRKSKQYEDLISGLRQSESIPNADILPCKITSESAPVWAAYYSMAPKSRTLFPNDCPLFKPR